MADEPGGVIADEAGGVIAEDVGRLEAAAASVALGAAPFFAVQCEAVTPPLLSPEEERGSNLEYKLVLQDKGTNICIFLAKAIQNLTTFFSLINNREN